MHKIIIIVIAFMLSFRVSAFGANLDDPAVPSKPTIRSEIKRGGEVAFSCSMQQSPTHTILAYEKCIESASKTQAEQGTGTQAFSLGLNFEAAIDAEIAYEAETNNGLSGALALSACKVYIAGVNETEKVLQIDDEHVVDALGMTKAANKAIKAARHNCTL